MGLLSQHSTDPDPWDLPAAYIIVIYCANMIKYDSETDSDAI